MYHVFVAKGSGEKRFCLCCLKLEILESSLSGVIDILQSVDLHWIWTLKVRNLWIEDIAPFGPYLGQMRNFHTLMLEDIVNFSGSMNLKSWKRCG